MIDANGMAEFNGVQNLEKSTLGHQVIAEILSFFSDAGKQITFRAKLKDYKGTVEGVHYLDKRNHIWMMAGRMVELDFPLLETPLPWIQANLVQCLDRVRNGSVNINSSIDYPIRSHSQNTC